MPIYAYRCARCGHELDALQKLSEPALVDCPACGEPALAKKLTAPGFQLKGSGWYQTDFRNSAKAADAKPAAKADAKAEPSADAKSETKTGTSDAAATKAAPKSEPSSPATPAASTDSGR